MENDRRSSVSRFQFRLLSDLVHRFHVDELLAVSERMLPDLLTALSEQIGLVEVPGLAAIPLVQDGVSDNQQLILQLTPHLPVPSQIVVQRPGVRETHHVTAVNHETSPAPRSVLQLAAALSADFQADQSTASVVAPTLFAVPPNPLAEISPAFVITLLDVREHCVRGGHYTQRDSFRQIGNQIVCSTRPSARPYIADFQIVVRVTHHLQHAHLYTHLLQRFSKNIPLVINGYPCPVWLVPSFTPDERRVEELAPLVVRVGTRLEAEARRQTPWVRQVDMQVGRQPPPPDAEQIVISFGES